MRKNLVKQALAAGRITLGTGFGQLRSPEIRETMSKVSMVKDPEIEKDFPREWPARAVIVLEDGRRLEQLIPFPKGDPENPLTWDEMALKFTALAGKVLSAERCEELIRQVRAGQALWPVRI